MDAVSIYNSNVYHCVTLSQNRYVNVNKLIDDLIDCIELYSESLTENNTSEANLCLFMYQNHIERLSNVILSVKEKSRQAMDIIEEYNSGKENICKLVDKCENNIKDAQDILETELVNSLLEEVVGFKEGETKAVEMFFVEDLWKNLNDNYCILNNTNKILESIKRITLENIKPEEWEELKIQYYNFQAMSRNTC